MPKIRDTCTFRFDGVRGALNANTLVLAVAIADQAARANVEIHAPSIELDGVRGYDSTCGSVSGPVRGSVQLALQYIEARGDGFPWRLKRHISQPTLLFFEERTDVEVATSGPRNACVNCDMPTGLAESPMCGPCAQRAVGAMASTTADAIRRMDGLDFVCGLRDPQTKRNVATAIARQVGHGMAEKCEAQAEAALNAILELLLHPPVLVLQRSGPINLLGVHS
ncbi:MULTISPECIES: hypothetical protein [Stenotrophomonas]|uniref:Uncharacterized protein n=1 Tax=Stenotrophomonas maltophilia TaxID=40324 RepID=A0AAI9CK11_STEMA|nr:MULTISPECIES: hypothetical protein [Stenotrophomonas]EKZ1928039.1 hypothetical protein [Stenotrophomonas maltophilia]EMB2746191.1 hypothetical protein [Stenotrophomonas maltophilia]KRG42123.1 hypothetical protein ARC63_11875 [Stenotrophomonas geniculata ATCC 19374 = JCM 13324]MBA0283792.1 hypothetical protein [Stenotrophomonas maltophilia]MBA0324099.1 hypothetical protein [Stenotrophomonas maltophilia]